MRRGAGQRGQGGVPELVLRSVGGVYAIHLANLEAGQSDLFQTVPGFDRSVQQGRCGNAVCLEARSLRLQVVRLH